MVENWKQYKDLEYYPDGVCACGCEDRIKIKPWHKYEGIPKYILGHNPSWNTGKKGVNISWNTNLTAATDERVARQGLKGTNKN